MAHRVFTEEVAEQGGAAPRAALERDERGRREAETRSPHSANASVLERHAEAEAKPPRAAPARERGDADGGTGNETSRSDAPAPRASAPLVPSPRAAPPRAPASVLEHGAAWHVGVGDADLDKNAHGPALDAAKLWLPAALAVLALATLLGLGRLASGAAMEDYQRGPAMVGNGRLESAALSRTKQRLLQREQQQQARKVDPRKAEALQHVLKDPEVLAKLALDEKDVADVLELYRDLPERLSHAAVERLVVTVAYRHRHPFAARQLYTCGPQLRPFSGCRRGQFYVERVQVGEDHDDLWTPYEVEERGDAWRVHTERPLPLGLRFQQAWFRFGEQESVLELEYALCPGSGQRAQLERLWRHWQQRLEGAGPALGVEACHVDVR